LGRQDHTISPYAGVHIVTRKLASTATCPDVSDDGRRPLYPGQDAGNMPQIMIAEKQNIFPAGTGQAGQISALRELRMRAGRSIQAQHALKRVPLSSPHEQRGEERD
jgi:hypothetical protein